MVSRTALKVVHPPQQVSLEIISQEKEFNGLVALIAGHEVPHAKASTSLAKVSGIFPQSYLLDETESAAEVTGSTNQEKYILALTWAAAKFVMPPHVAKKDGITNFLLAMRNVYLEGMGMDPPINPFDKFRPAVVWTIRNYIIQGGLDQVGKYIKHGYDERWEISAREQLDVIRRFLQLFNMPIQRIGLLNVDYLLELNKRTGEFITACERSAKLADQARNHARAVQLREAADAVRVDYRDFLLKP
ncbi:hypothetical protein HYU40_03310 [Candidatus Woesearchaeota archaeon]|nr:hypothetical protein [Candidatus Woesearchaeota archaeon]